MYLHVARCEARTPRWYHPPMSSRRAIIALAVGMLGCGGAQRTAVTPKAPPPGGIEAAALPYQVLDARTGRQIDTSAFWEQLGEARAICIGEDHSNPHHHWVQLEIVRTLGEQRPPGDRLALGLEMFQRPFQGVLDDYAAGRIDDATLRSRAGWKERWGYDWGFYGPTIDAAVAAGATLLALNAPRELTKKVAKKGLAGLAPDERAQIPELVLDDPTHRAWFDAVMEAMGGAHAHARQPTTPEPETAPEHGAAPHGAEHATAQAEAPSPDAAPPHAAPPADNIYTVQVLWDETMADVAARWLAANPTGRAILLAGNGHCHDSAIVRRLERRGIGDVVSVRPIIDTEGRVAEALASPMNDFVFVMSPPRREGPVTP